MILRPVLLLFCLAYTTVWAQEVKTVLSWAQDTMALGRPVVATLVIRHPPGVVVRVADKKTDLQPWEMVEKKQYYPDNQKDSLIYVLRSWSPAASQQLQLGYSYLTKGRLKKDTTNQAVITLNSRLPAQADLQYRQDNTLMQVGDNKPNKERKITLWLIIQFILVVLLFIGSMFRKKIMRAWRRYLLGRAYRRLQKQIAALQPLIQQDVSLYTEQLNLLWMKYLADKSLSTFTPAEIKAWSNWQPVLDEQAILYRLSATAERLVYGHIRPQVSELQVLTQQLEEYLNKVYLKRRHAI